MNFCCNGFNFHVSMLYCDVHFNIHCLSISSWPNTYKLLHIVATSSFYLHFSQELQLKNFWNLVSMFIWAYYTLWCISTFITNQLSVYTNHLVYSNQCTFLRNCKTNFYEISYQAFCELAIPWGIFSHLSIIKLT